MASANAVVLSDCAKRVLTEEVCQEVTRPRKTLDWKGPAELFLPEGTFDFVHYWSAKINPVALDP